MPKNTPRVKSLNRISALLHIDYPEPVEVDDGLDIREAAAKAREHDEDFGIPISLDV